MNPEVRFRVPRHVHQLAQEKAETLGLKSRRGRTGGASELARGALYVFLGLGLPSNLESLDTRGFQEVKAQRISQDTPQILVTVHHRVADDYRKEKALKEKRQVAARATTEFAFEQGELPHFLVPYITLTESGSLYSTLNLEGSLSPRRHVLGKLVTATERATITELEDCLNALEQKKQKIEALHEERQRKLERGTKFLADWASKRGGELLRARLDSNFEWLGLAAEEYARTYLADLGIEELQRMETTTSLASDASEFRDVQLQRSPQLPTIKLYQQLKALDEPGLELQVVTVRQDGHPKEGIMLSLELPVPDKIHFLTALIPI